MLPQQIDWVPVDRELPDQRSWVCVVVGPAQRLWLARCLELGVGHRSWSADLQTKLVGVTHWCPIMLFPRAVADAMARELP
jgi:hypothetical protein